jgi:hypothetical protein
VNDFFHDLEEDAADFEDPAAPEPEPETSPDVERVRLELE